MELSTNFTIMENFTIEFNFTKNGTGNRTDYFDIKKGGSDITDLNCTEASTCNSTYFYDVNSILELLRPPEYLLAIEVTLSIVGMLLNICHGTALINMNNPWNTQTKLIASLAVADFVIATLHLVQQFYAFPTMLSFGIFLDVGFIQLLLSFVYSTAQVAQMLTMIGFAVNLFIATKMPLHYERMMSQYRGNVMVCCFWIVTGLVFGVICLLVKILGMLVMSILIVFIVIASTVSAIFLIVLYSVVFREVYNLKKRSPRFILLRKSALTFLTILLTYLLFMMPGTWVMTYTLYQFTHFDENVKVDTFVNTVVQLIAVLTCLYVLNSVCDPFIYLVRISEIRDSYRNIFKKIRTGIECKCDNEAT